MVGSRAVLVIDDQADIRSLLKLLLQDHGYQVSTAQHGAAALEQIELDTFSVILLDVQMPVMDGVEFVRAYRSLPGHQAQIVIMTAGRSATEYAEQVGADRYLAKPFDLDEVLGVVETLAEDR